MAGLRVLDVSKVWSGPMAGCVLADMGADVVRVEMPGNREGELPPALPGTTRSWFRESVNRNKRSLSLDLRKDGAAEVFLRLVDSADVVLENYLPGTMERWGVGYRHCRERRPDIVYVSLSGYGQYGPGAGRPGYDPVVQADTGWMALNGTCGGGPVRAPTFLADDLAGLHAALGALAALRHRDATGEGQHVDVAMQDALLFQSAGYLTLAAAGAPPRRWGNQTEFVAPSNIYDCADGQVYVTVALDRQWRRFTELAGRTDLARAPGYGRNTERLANRHAVDRLLAEWCGAHDSHEAVRKLQEAGITAARVRDYAEAAADPQVREREMLVDTELADGSTAPLTGTAVKFSRTPTTVRRAAPLPGADTDALLAEAGYDSAARARLRERGVV
nr:CoA transferase [Streptomyces sp. SID8354]